MAAVRTAFPVLVRGASATPLATQMRIVSRTPLASLQLQLQEIVRAPLPLTGEGLLCAMQVGADLTVPLTVVGACDDDNVAGGEAGGCLVVHSPGLPGGFVVSPGELLRSRARLRPPCRSGVAGDSPSSLGTVCLMEAVSKEWAGVPRSSPVVASSPSPPPPCSGVLDTFYRLARRRHFSLAGMARVMECGARLHTDALQLDFPYQCGGAQATKRYLDITADVADVFGAHMRHGTKVLSRYGVAVSVGVVDRLTSLATPALLWHPSGAQAACIAPILHGCPLLPLGTVTLDYNGPVPGSRLNSKEDPRRYMDVASQSDYDGSAWLTQGLFGVRPGDAWSPPASPKSNGHGTTAEFEVVGVAYSEAAEEMELLVRDPASGTVVAAADV
ncbi:hypothetical protein NESM_000472200 [Novymonas esmeraldas]|uniref:Uncharacterized protein n=1 Tax=Novymonas esmeraldas TaxID=1808958 RepID=A0AAW0EP07_9TRYP